MTRRYTILDVFTATPLEGNPLAIVEDAIGLSSDVMQRIAREFNLAETVFLLPAENPVHTARLRIFTPAGELPFAGHPTIGTAIFLARQRNAPTPDALLTLEESVGPIRCGTTLHGRGGRAWFGAPKSTEQPLSASVDDFAAALGVDPGDIGFENHKPTAYSAGVTFIFVPVRNLAAIAKAGPRAAHWNNAFGDVPAYLYTRETESVSRQFHARMFAPALGIAEDPATGAAAAAFSAVAHNFDAHADGSHVLIIEQGFEMGRPSLISLELDIEGGQLAASRIGGEAVIVAHGEIDI